MSKRTGKQKGNFVLMVMSSDLKKPRLISLRDCLIYIRPSGPGKTYQNLVMQSSCLVRPNGKLEIRSGIVDTEKRIEIGNQVLLETDPVQDQTDYLVNNYYINNKRSKLSKKQKRSRKLIINQKNSKAEERFDDLEKDF